MPPSLHRRRLLKLVAAAGLATVLKQLVSLGRSAAETVSKVFKRTSYRGPGKYAMLVDITKCDGCMRCVVACKKWNSLPWGNYPEGYPTELDYNTWTVVKKVVYGGRTYYIKVQCMHCNDPICVAVCPVGARWKTPEGNVLVDTMTCVGCKYCVEVCPFNIPRYDEVEGVVRNCWLCYNRVLAGMRPACVDACPRDALDFGPREKIVEKALRRAKEIGGRVYGLSEAGGTTVLYVSDVPLEKLGFPSPQLLGTRSLADRELEQLRTSTPLGVLLGFLAGFLVKLYTRRRVVSREGGSS